jgi:hypothetical protein
MFFHLCSAEELDTTDLTIKDLSSLLITSLAEIHANAELFGGVDSVSFKSKYKQIDRRGNKFCKKNFEKNEEYGHSYVFIRNNISDSQKIVQTGHVSIELSKKFDLKYHPSLICLSVKSEEKLIKTIQELIDNGIDFTIFREPDLNNEITAVATKPLTGKQREIFKRYQLMR